MESSTTGVGVDEWSSTRTEVINAIGAARIVPVLRLNSSAECIALAMHLLSSGLALVEIAATTPGWLPALIEVRQRHPDATIGVGTVLDLDSARSASEAGANFLVSPHVNDELRREYGEILIEGGLSPGEVVRAARYGIAKLFPAHVGGPHYLRSLLAVYPESRIMPTGGLQLGEAARWLQAGAYAVGVGSGLADVDDPAGAIVRALESAQE